MFFQVLRQGKKLFLEVPLWIPQRLVPRTLLQQNVINTATNTGSTEDSIFLFFLIFKGNFIVSNEYLNRFFSFSHCFSVFFYESDVQLNG